MKNLAIFSFFTLSLFLTGLLQASGEKRKSSVEDNVFSKAPGFPTVFNEFSYEVILKDTAKFLFKQKKSYQKLFDKGPLFQGKDSLVFASFLFQIGVSGEVGAVKDGLVKELAQTKYNLNGSHFRLFELDGKIFLETPVFRLKRTIESFLFVRDIFEGLLSGLPESGLPESGLKDFFENLNKLLFLGKEKRGFSLVQGSDIESIHFDAPHLLSFQLAVSKTRMNEFIASKARGLKGFKQVENKILSYVPLAGGAFELEVEGFVLDGDFEESSFLKESFLRGEPSIRREEGLVDFKKLKKMRRGRVSDLVLITTTVDSPKTYFYEEDVLQFYHQTSRHIEKDVGKSRLVSFPVFLSLKPSNPSLYELAYYLHKLASEKQLPLTIHVVGHGKSSEPKVCAISSEGMRPRALANIVANELETTEWPKGKKIHFHFHICYGAFHKNEDIRKGILEESFIGIFRKVLSDLGYKVKVTGYFGSYSARKASAGAEIRLGKDIRIKKSQAAIRIDENGKLFVHLRMREILEEGLWREHFEKKDALVSDSEVGSIEKTS